MDKWNTCVNLNEIEKSNPADNIEACIYSLSFSFYYFALQCVRKGRALRGSTNTHDTSKSRNHSTYLYMKRPSNSGTIEYIN